MNDKPKAKAAAIRAKLKYPSIEMFVQRYSQNVSKYGIFFKTSKPKPIGTTVKFELKISDDTTVLRGMGEVSWTREVDEGNAPAGMGIKFKKLDANSRNTVKKILIYKRKSSSTEHSRYSQAPPPPAEDSASKEADKLARLEAEKQARIEAEEQARIEAEEQARIEAEEQARIEAEEQARIEAEEQARIEAEELARLEAEEQAKIEAEKLVKKETEEQALRAQRAKEKLEALQRSGARIEANEGEIDDIVAAFDSIQLPYEPSNPTPEPPVVTPEDSLRPNVDDVVDDSDLHNQNLEESLFDSEELTEDSRQRANIDDLIGQSLPSAQETFRSTNEEEPSLFENEVGPASFEGRTPLSVEHQYPQPQGLVEAPNLLEAEEAQEYDFDDSEDAPSNEFLFENAKKQHHPDKIEEISAIEEISVLEEISMVEEISVIEEISVVEEPASTPMEQITEEENLFLNGEDYVIEEFSQGDEDIEDIEEIEELTDEMTVDFEGAAPIALSDKIDNLIDEFSKDSLQPQAVIAEPLLANQIVDNALDDIFAGNSAQASRPRSNREQQLDKISNAPDTLPDDALPAKIAEIVKQKSMVPTPAASPFIQNVANSTVSPQVQQPASAPAPQSQQQPISSSPNTGMPGAQSQWGNPNSGAQVTQQQVQQGGSPTSGMPGAQSQWGNPNNGMPGAQSQWGNPNNGMPGAQSQWGQSSPPEDDDDLDPSKKKGFFGKLFGK